MKIYKQEYKWVPVPFEWYELDGHMVLVPVLSCTGLKVIPGCEQTTDNPQGSTITFEDKEYRNYSINPMGAVILGNDGVYSDKLSQDKLLPDTGSPILCPFLQYQQVTGCGGTGVWSWQTDDNKWVVSFNRIQRVDYDGSGKRPFLYYQIIYDYATKQFTFSYKEAETSPDSHRPTQRGSISAIANTMSNLEHSIMLKDVSFRLGAAVTPVDIEPEIEDPIKPPFSPVDSWVRQSGWYNTGDKFEYEIRKREVK